MIQSVERTSIRRLAIALTDQCLAGTFVRRQAEPREILEDAILVRGPGSLAIVILDTQHDAPVERTRDAPDVNSVDDVAEVEPSRG